MLKGDNGKFLRELTDLIFRQLLTNAISFFNLEDTEEHRLFYGYVFGDLAAFIIRWITLLQRIKPLCSWPTSFCRCRPERRSS